MHLLQHTEAEIGSAMLGAVRRLAVLVAFACLALSLAACDSDDGEAAAPAAGDRSVFLEGGSDAFEKRIESERGTPVVVNKWASWCGPCRLEFPLLTSQAKKRKGEVEFLGVNSYDHTGLAEDFLRDNPTPFPHFEDPDEEIARVLRAPFFPSTAFYDSKGELAFVHQGVYASEADLADDIERYAR